MSRKYIELISFSLLFISCIIIVNGLNFEGVRSSGAGKGKATDDGEGTDKFLKAWDKTDSKKHKNVGSSSATVETEETLVTGNPPALGDALDNICKGLIIKDLMIAGTVCREWRDAASREMSNRGVEGAVLPHIYSTQIQDINSNFHVTHVLRTKPHVALLFVAPTLDQRNCPEQENLEHNILDTYKKFFPQYLVTVGVHVSMMNEEIITSCPGEFGPPNGILGLFIPLYKDLEVKVSQCTITSYQDSELCAEKVMDGLMPVNHNKQTTLIMFGTSYLGAFTAEYLLPLIKANYVQKRYTLWGGIFNDKLEAFNSQKSKRLFLKKERSFFAISLTGSNIKSWSIVIDCLLHRFEFDRKLLEFRSNIELKSTTVGLAYGPRYVRNNNGSPAIHVYEDNIQIMDAVKRVFPDILFEGVFNFGNHSHFGVNSMIDDNNQDLGQRMAVSLLIITHD